MDMATNIKHDPENEYELIIGDKKDKLRYRGRED